MRSSWNDRHESSWITRTVDGYERSNVLFLCKYELGERAKNTRGYFPMVNNHW